MSFKKIFFINIWLYLLLNLVFLAIYAVLYGLGGMGITEVFGELPNDIWGLITAILTPGGTSTDFISSTMYHLSALFTPGGRIAYHIIGLLWIFLPGTISAFVAGRKYSLESTKKSYWGTILAITLLALLPIVFVAIPSLDMGITGVFSANVVSPVYWTAPAIVEGLQQYIVIVLYAFLNSAFFGGIAAASSTII